MKTTNLLFALIFFITSITFAQTGALNQNVVNNTGASLFTAANAGKSSYGASTMFVNSARDVEGSVYLFNSWENSGVIIASNKQRFRINNININIKNNSIDSKMGQDSLFSFNFKNIEKFVINERVFNKFNWKNDKKIFEILFDSEKKSLLKGYSVKFVQGSPNPMVNRPKDKNIRRDSYYLKNKNNNIERIKLNKKSVLLAFSDSKKQVAKYVKENKLSYKKEIDVIKMFKYYNSL